MRIARALNLRLNTIRYGVLKNDDFLPVEEDMFKVLTAGEVMLSCAAWTSGTYKLLAPCEPTKIVAVGLNYRSHAEEMKHDIPEEPLIFLKPPSALIGPGDFIELPRGSKRVDYECELAVVIGKHTKNVASRDARAHILGYTCFNDVTERVIQKKDGQWSRAKGFDTFACAGPWIETDIDPSSLGVRTVLNGTTVQQGSTADLIFTVEQLVAFVSSIMTLNPGDLIATGTPSGIGRIAAGDTVEVIIDGIGTLTNPVRNA